MRRSLHHSRGDAEIPTASMADIAFLLITFFMVTTVFTAIHGIEYGLPKKTITSKIQPKESVYIHLLNSGDIQVDFQTVPNLTGLASYVKAKMAETSGLKPVIIRTDLAVPYGRMVEVLDLLKQLDVKKISIPTHSELEAWKDYFTD